MKRTITALVAALLIGAVAIAGVSAVTVANTSQQVQGGENLLVDVEVNETELTKDSVSSENITVDVFDSDGNLIGNKTITVDSYDSSGTVLKTVEFTELEPANDSEYYSIEVNATKDRYVDNVFTDVEESSGAATGGGIGGASGPAVLGFLIVVVGLLYAYEEDMI